MDRRALLLAMLAAAGCTAIRPALPSRAGAGEWTLNAPGIGALRISIRLPGGYDVSKGRHGVVYLHDGQNLFDPAVSAYGRVWHVDRAARELVAAGRIAPPILVGIWNPGADRTRTYLPQPAFDRLPSEVRNALAARIGGPVQSAAYLHFLTAILKPAIDRAYRTRRDPGATTIMGSSMGGLISLHAFAEHPDIYGRAGCLSTHWPIFLPERDGAAVPYREQVTAAWTGYLRDRLGPSAGRRLWFDHGTATLDALYAPYQAAVDGVLPLLGWRKGQDFVSRTYPGAAHDEPAWAARVADPLAFLLA